ncbi:MAG: hypothetical protein AAB521_03930 [Patescibacteria group bacterium]
MTDVRERYVPRIFSRRATLQMAGAGAVGLFVGAEFGCATERDVDFTSPHLGYTMDYQKGWSSGSYIEDDGSYVDYFLSDEDNSADCPQVQIFVQRTSMDLDSYANLLATTLDTPQLPRRQHGPKVENCESRIITGMGKEGIFKHEILTFKKDEFAYVVEYIASPTKVVDGKSEFDAYLKTARQMRSSLRITGIPKTPEPIFPSSI